MLKLFRLFLSTMIVLGLVGMVSVGYVFYHYSRDLPAYDHLKTYEPPITTRVYAADGRLMAEYAIEKRVYLPIDAIPKRVRNAFISAEDKSFYSHPGIDVQGVLRAVVTNLRNMSTGRRPEGASTITQQVAKNFLLTNEVSIERKIKEALLAFRIEQAYSKDYILELYLNEIYLGFQSYGVAAAALNYFNKSVDELTIGEAAFLAALPKAPNNYNPVRHPDAAYARRNWVIGRMLEDGHITPEQAQAALAEDIILRRRDEAQSVYGAGFFSEEIRRTLAARYGEDALYQGGLAVRSTLNPDLQKIAGRVLREGLIDYDRRHGWRGPVTTLPVEAGWAQALSELERPAGVPDAWRVALVLRVEPRTVTLGFSSGTQGTMDLDTMTWARPWREEQHVGPQPDSADDVVAVGDVILVEPATDDSGETIPNAFALRQMPNVEGALVAMDPHTGRVLAMMGGFSADRSEFNRATQARRQPGSAFKPFVYLAALEDGYTPASIILDAPFVYDQGPGLAKWKPKNYSNRFYGPSTLRMGIEKSRNLMTVRLAQAVGMDRVADVSERFGVVDDMPQNLAASLGSTETTVLRLTTAYAMIVNGGRRIEPTLIDRIQDRHGTTIYRHDGRPCRECEEVDWTGQSVPWLPDPRPQVIDSLTAYQMVSILEGVVQRGTGVRIGRTVDKPVAGKTGTSNDSVDTWFVGFSPDLAVGVFVGFDEPRTLGSREQGARTAGPIFAAFMKDALADTPARPFRVPPGIEFVTIDRITGQRASGGEGTITEAFKPGEGPVRNPTVLDGSGALAGYGAEYGVPSTAGVGVVPMPGAWNSGAPVSDGSYQGQPYPGQPSSGQPYPGSAPGSASGGQAGTAPPPPPAGGSGAPQAGGLY
ncbi:penicillin-binding protein 1A [Roseospira marina]|uniref:Penicillin-binding protein 1A n=1 Tax=Roseospira marina TaxID=140057 RepID=A0A5M6I7I6_9PROT|nr:penicillin-binding protein 1A [Roseospira marina]KAA5603847.1 penicillin-binding protein 1A [Roseospira marina]MBB4313764.1 penicillin-binding protein 1A [Roseospira marina]MBB5086926.1 penicillin-binding protein 1A [Roseospira marina]